jgi:predicted TPR repeat methyltransferase
MDCDRCIRVEPAWVKGHYRKGTSLEALGRFDEAQAAYESALQAEPSNTDVRKKLNELTARTRGCNPPRGESIVVDTCTRAKAAAEDVNTKPPASQPSQFFKNKNISAFGR